VVDVPAGRTAVELEFTSKAAVRLKSIGQRYSRSVHYSFVDFVLLERPEDAALRRRLEAMIGDEHALEKRRTASRVADGAAAACDRAVA